MEYQHYIGTGPEAEAIIAEANARRIAFSDAAKAFADEQGSFGSWQRGSFNGPVVAGPTFERTLTNGEMSARGLKYYGIVDGQHAYAPRLNTKAGKVLAETLCKLNTLAFDPTGFVIKETGMDHTVYLGGMLAHSTAGYSAGVIVVKVPTGGDHRGNMPTPPAWLAPCKESEALAALGK